MPDAPAGEPIPVKLMNEYTVDLPLWAPDGLPPEDTYPISAGLRARLMDWAATFNEHFDWDTGWDDERRRVAHRTEGLALHRELADELGPGYDVSFSLWESDVHDAEVLLAGPRGRRLCLELAAAQQDRSWTAMVTASWFFELEQGTPYWLMALDGADTQAPDEEGEDGEDGENDTPATTADAAVRDLVRALSEFTMGKTGVPSARAVHAALVESVDSARYWQEPDGVDVLAAQHRVRNALVPIADRVMQSEPARSWTAGRGVEQ